MTYVMTSNVYDCGQNALFSSVIVNHVTLMHDLEIWGRTSFNLTIHNLTCNSDSELTVQSIFDLF